MSRRENKSLAKNFSILSALEQESKKLNVEFIVNVNTSAERASPYYSLTSFCEIKTEDNNKNIQNNQEKGEQKEEEQLLVAVKTESNVAIIELKNGIPSKDVNLLNISGKSMQNQSICYHSFVNPVAYTNTQNQKKPQGNAPMYVCFSSGKILVVEALSSNFIYIFNSSSDKGDNVWHQKKVNKIITLPEGKSFLVLFSDSTIIEYGLNPRKENFQFQEDINKLESQISFQPKKFGQPTQRKVFSSFEYSSNNKSEFIGFACYSLQENLFCGPNKFYKFKCPSISDFEVLPNNHHLYSVLKGRTQRASQLIAFAGLDGILRIIDLVNFLPVYSFKSYYGGINSFSFDSTIERSPLVAISCQDDSVLVLNTRLNTFTRIIGHCSFISHSILTSITPQIIRVTAASFDGFISISDFYRDVLDDPQSRDAAELEYEQLPIKLKFETAHSQIFKDISKHKLNEEGLSYLVGFKDYFLTSAFDGCASLFKFWEIMPDYQKGKFSEDPPSQADQGNNSSMNNNSTYNQQSKIASEANREGENKYNKNNSSNKKTSYQEQGRGDSYQQRSQQQQQYQGAQKSGQYKKDENYGGTRQGSKQYENNINRGSYQN